MVRVVAPDRISAPRGLSTRPLPRPRPSHFELWDRTDHPPRSRELVINVVPHGDSTARGAAEEYRIGVGRELTISGPLVLRIYAGALLLALFSVAFLDGQSSIAGHCTAHSSALCSSRLHKFSCLCSSLFDPSSSRPRDCATDFIRVSYSCPPSIGLCTTNRLSTTSPSADNPMELCWRRTELKLPRGVSAKQCRRKKRNWKNEKERERGNGRKLRKNI
ncbi:hypothetical protein niasHT_020091 [Heterodera trifolii]|uniref:Uncharacterized protein n=1 Tax=Heterodera trifolii TaxID=157864 RepID=A0ABD2LJK7_9BILA